MSKSSKRKITVDLNIKTGKDQPKSRPSVFERLGTKASTEYCRHWAQSGNCPYGKNCKYASTHILISPSKQRAAKKDGPIDSKKKLHQSVKDDPNKRLHSTVVKAGRNSELEWDNWDQTDLEYADADALEKRRQELQRELELQLKMESKQSHKKDKKPKKRESSSSSTGSTSTTTESSSSTDDSSSVSSSSSKESNRRPVKKTKGKRSSSSSDTELSHKKKTSSKTSANNKRTVTHQKLATRLRENSHSKKSTENVSPMRKTTPKTPPSKLSRSPTPRRPLSTTPPLKNKSTTPLKNNLSVKTKVGRSSRSLDRKEKCSTPSPRPPTRNKDRDDKEKQHKLREREKEREKEREREIEREKEREREKDREKEKVKDRERNYDRDREQSKTRGRDRSVTPKKDLRVRDGRKRDTPDSNRDRNRGTPNRLHSNLNRRRDEKSDDRRSDKSKEEERKKDERDRKIKDRSLERIRKDDTRRNDDRDKNRDNRDKDRDIKRMTREEREAAREKEREEALARCQERQRERERLKKIAEKEREMHLRNRERERERDRGLDKPLGDKVERLLPHPSERLPPSVRLQELERSTSKPNDRRDRSIDRGSERNLNRTDRTHPRNRRSDSRNYESVERTYRDRGFERDREVDRERNERDYSTTRGHDDRRLHSDEKEYNSPYENRRLRDDRHFIDEKNSRYEDVSHHIESRDYADDRRSHQETWDERTDPREIRERELSHRNFVRDTSRPGNHKVHGEWDKQDYINSRHEWSDRPPPAHEWEERGREEWEASERPVNEEEWRANFNRPIENWQNDERRRNWPKEWPERITNAKRPPLPTVRTKQPIQREEKISTANKEDSRRIASKQCNEPDAEPVDETNKIEIKKDNLLGKRAADTSIDGASEAKKPFTPTLQETSAPLETDDLSEISDDADEILDREDDVEDFNISNSGQFPSTDVTKHFDILQEIVEQSTEPTSTILDINEKVCTENSTNENEIITNETKPASPRTPTITTSTVGPNQEITTDQNSVDEEAIDQMDFEEISDEELEEETKIKGLGDALGVDWASLVAESKPRIKTTVTGSAKKRWDPHRVLARIGISIEMTGVKLATDVFSKISKQDEQLDKENTMNDEIKSEIKVETDNEYGNKLKITNVLDNVHPIAGMQVSLKDWTAKRRALFISAGPFKRALCARRDLDIRRYLCKLPIKDTIGLGDTQHAHDPELFKMALKLYERTL